MFGEGMGGIMNGKATHQQTNGSSWGQKITFIQHLVAQTNIVVSIIADEDTNHSNFVDTLKKEMRHSCRIHYWQTSIGLSENEIGLQVGQLLNPSLNKNIIELITHYECTDDKPLLLIIDKAEDIPQTFMISLINTLYQYGEQRKVHLCLVSHRRLLPLLNKVASLYPDFIHTIDLCATKEEKTTISAMKNDGQQKKYKEIPSSSSAFFVFYRRWIKHMQHFQKLPPVSQATKVSLLLIGLFGGFFLFNQFHTSSSTITTTYQDAAGLNSKIPSYQLAATKQLLQPMALHQAKAIVLEEEETLDSSLVMMDKVVVLPKHVEKAKNSRRLLTTPTVVARSKSTVSTNKHLKNEPQTTYYTIQLLASGDKEKLLSFSKTLPAQQKTRILTLQHQGRPWYVLTWGNYKQREQAKKALHALPIKLAAHQPWVRKCLNSKELG